MSQKACDGGPTYSVRQCGEHMEECIECGTQVRWDLVDDKFWGFQNCRDKSPSAGAVDPHTSDQGTPSMRERKNP